MIAESITSLPDKGHGCIGSELWYGGSLVDRSQLGKEWRYEGTSALTQSASRGQSVIGAIQSQRCGGRAARPRLWLWWPMGSPRLGQCRWRQRSRCYSDKRA